MRITNELTLDVARSNSAVCLLAKQGDSNSRYLAIKLTNEGHEINIPNGAGVILRATKADGTAAAVAGSVSGGKATVELDDYILDAAGAARASLEITAGGEVLTTASFNLTVQKADGAGWVLVYVAASNLPAGNYYITLGGVSYSFTTTQTIPSGGRIYFSSNSATAQTRNGSGAVLDAALTLTVGSTGTALTSDLPTMSFLASLATTKADKDGVIAYADNLTPYDDNSGAGQTQPFLVEGTGTGNGESTVDVGSFCQLKEKRGNTVVVNQLCDIADGTQAGAGNQLNTHLTDFFTDRYYIFMVRAVFPSVPTSEGGSGFPASPVLLGFWKGTSYRRYLFNYSPSGFYIAIAKGSDLAGTMNNMTDTTITLQMFPNAGETVTFSSVRVIDLTLWYGSNDRIPSDLLAHPEDFGKYYAGSLDYNAGQLVNADGTTLTSKDGSNNVLAAVDTGSEVLRSAGIVADEKTPDGTITRRVGTVDLGTLNYADANGNGQTYSNTISGIRFGGGTEYGSFVISAIFTGVNKSSMGQLDDGEMSVDTGGHLQICKTAWANYSGAQLAAALSGVMLYFELDTYSTETGTPFNEYLAADALGTLEWTETHGVPQGNLIFYPFDYKKALDDLLHLVNGDIGKIVTAAKVPDAPTTDGTYVLKCTVSSGTPTYFWDSGNRDLRKTEDEPEDELEEPSDEPETLQDGDDDPDPDPAENNER